MRAPHPLGYDLIIFDADGTLRECTIPGQPCPNKPDEWRLLPKVKATLALYDWDRTGLGIVSNQGGVGLGYLSHANAFLMLSDTVLAAIGCSQVAAIRMCPHAPKDGCPCRKPSPMMINYMVKDFAPIETIEGIEGHPMNPKVLYVGDMDTDRECARNAGVDFMWAKDFFGWDEDCLNADRTETI